MSVPVLIRDAPAIVGQYVIYEHTVSTNSSFKVPHLASISKVVAIKFVDWSDVTTTISGTNIIVTQAGLTAVRVLFIVCGEK